MRFKRFVLPLHFVTIILFIISCLSCTKEKEIEDGNLIQTLKSNKWITRDVSYDEASGNHAWLDIETCYLYFTSDNSGVSYWILKDYDTDLGNSTRKEYTLFTYYVSGNTVTITDESNNVSEYIYSEGYLFSESGSTIFESKPMTSNDYDFVYSLGPKSGTCGSNLKYTYDDRTSRLTISGSGKMNDYTSSNQPWHDFSISQITIEEGCTYIGTHAFHKLSYVVSEIEIPNSIQEFGDYSCCDLFISELMVPTEVVRIGKNAFSDCEYLKKINFAGCDKLTEIDDYAFAFCPISFSYFTLAKNVKNVGIMALANSSFTGSFALNEKIETIGDGAFASLSGRMKAGTLIIPNSVKSIGSQAFHGNIGEIRIGTGLTKLGDTPFIANSKGSMYVNLGKPVSMANATYKYIISNTDGNVTRNWTLYVPKGSKSAYQNAEGWKSFKSIIEDASLKSGNGSGDDNPNSSSYTGTVQGHNYVDLGLSVKWATCNVGASKPENYGWYYMWGETTTSGSIPDYWGSLDCKEAYELYDKNTQKCKNIGNDISGTKYDAAYKEWGSKWRMATLEEWKELVNNCSWIYTKQNGADGMLGTAKNGQTIFLPAAGRKEGIRSSEGGYYWSSNIAPEDIDDAQYAVFHDDSYKPQTKKWSRWAAMSIRAVTK